MSHFSNSYFCHLWVASLEHTLLLFLKDSSIPQFIVNIPMNKQDTTTCNTAFQPFKHPELETHQLFCEAFLKPKPPGGGRTTTERRELRAKYAQTRKPKLQGKSPKSKRHNTFFSVKTLAILISFFLCFFCFPSFFVSPGSVGNVGKQVWRSLACG